MAGGERARDQQDCLAWEGDADALHEQTDEDDPVAVVSE